ncbi:hypothetical protein [Sandaracinus amylolyticus]|uniref:monooxygenase n=1 Tax=Sandaracinus amylolyticus TaxID=927083 RepID=UPI001F18566E|nr:hypothetical protein [Sandaracinus amylolyticus]UJR85734.1 Hypothetical protein I5071_78140 [Sandaracinus amylolyticus]
MRRTLILVAVMLAACDHPSDDATPDGGAPLAPSYHEHVRPILARHCAGCHVEGGIAPLALDTYDAVRPLAARIAEVTRARTMPPYPVDGSGECNTFRGARWLSDDELATLERWHHDGAPEGDPSTPPPAPIALPRLEGDVRTLDIGVEYQPRTDRPDDYRCFFVDAPATEDTYYVTGFDVHPGNARVAHHVIVFHPASDDEVVAARALDDADPAPGYECFGASGVRASAVAAWAPGGGATFYPDGTGVQLRGGRPLIVQMHYNTLASDGAPDRTRVDVAVATSGVTPGRFLPLADLALELPPREEEVTWSTTLRVSDHTTVRTPFRVRGVFPHMHTLGRTLRIDVERADASRECLVDVPRWDFDWQMLYFYEGSGMLVQPDDAITIRCTYDTRDRESTTTWGEGTMDEMCVTGLFVTL